MNSKKIQIHLVTHKPTGAEIPIIIRKVNEKNIVEDYVEYVVKRKGFKLQMLQNRWDKCREDTLEILKEYQVPAYISHAEMLSAKDVALPIDVAIFWEEYIYAIEKKEEMPHKKLKAKFFEHVTEN